MNHSAINCQIAELLKERSTCMQFKQDNPSAYLECKAKYNSRRESVLLACNIREKIENYKGSRKSAHSYQIYLTMFGISQQYFNKLDEPKNFPPKL